MATNILMPALSPTMEEGKLSKWLVKEGDTVKSGDILAEIETDKATMEFEAVDEGKIGKILVAEGTEGVKVNTPIADAAGRGRKGGAAVDIPAAMKEIKDAVKAEVPKAPNGQSGAAGKSLHLESLSPQGGEAPKAALRRQSSDGNRIFASPLARRIAAGKGIDIAALSGSGPRGRIVSADVESAKPGVAKAAPAAAASAGGAGIPGVAPLPDARLLYPAGSYVETPHDSMRKAIAKRLTSAKTLIPHYYLTVDCNLNALMAAREKMNAAAPKNKDKTPAYKLSVNDFIMKASAMALMKHPDVNASWTDTAILRHKDADVGVAVALDFGLITPIVFKAQTKGLVEISRDQIPGSARQGKKAQAIRI